MVNPYIQVVKGNNFVINGSIKKKKILCPQHFIINPYIQVVKIISLLMDQSKKKKKYGSAYFSYRKYILSFRVLHKLVSKVQ